MLNILKHPSSKSASAIEENTSDPSAFENSVTRANKFIENGNWEAAYPYIKTAVETKPDYAQGFNHLGIYYTKHQRSSEAIITFRKALQIDFTMTEAHYNLANLYMERKEYNKSLSHFKEVVVANPGDYETYYLMGLCCIHSNLEKDALAFFYESLRLAPAHIPSVVELCRILIKNDNCSKAKNILLSLLKNDASVIEVHFLLGVIYKIQKNYAKAMKHFHQTLLKDKNNTAAYNLLGECCIELKMEEQAKTLFAMAIKLDTTFLSAFYNLGDLYYRQKKYADAISTMEEYVKTKKAADSISELWSETPVANNEEEIIPLYNLLGYCYKMAHNPIKARDYWKISLAIQPQQQDITAALNDTKQPSPRKRVSLVID